MILPGDLGGSGRLLARIASENLKRVPPLGRALEDGEGLAGVLGEGHGEEDIGLRLEDLRM